MRKRQGNSVCAGLPRYYVYTHRDPDSGEIVYVGMGSYERAWLSRGGHRCPEHSTWMCETMDRGITPDRFVFIEAGSMLKRPALEVEKSLIGLHQPRFNKIQGMAIRKLLDSSHDLVSTLRGLGFSHTTVAEMLGDVSTMTVYRFCKRRRIP